MELYRNFLTLARPLFDTEEWRSLKGLIYDGINAGIYDTDSHGISVLERCIRTGLVLLDKTGLKRAPLLTVLFDPMIRSGNIEHDKLETLFGKDTAGLMKGMSRVKGLYSKHDSIADDNFRKLLISFAEDIRVIICLIADRYVLMHMLSNTSDVEYRLRVTEECRLLYTPMAHRLGLYAIKSELEDMTLKYEHRDVYDDIAHQLNETKRAREAYIQSFITPVKQRLEEAGLKFTIKGRTKSIYSIWNKMKAQNTARGEDKNLLLIHIHGELFAKLIGRGVMFQNFTYVIHQAVSLAFAFDTLI
jgi:guanosine-3',5'-bis(diphosphate) 3'-pyrophosphohydrolase